MADLVSQWAQRLWWAAAALVVYTYAVYPVVLLLLTWRRRDPALEASQQWPTASLILAAHNEAKVIRQKLENALALEYPAGRLQVVLVSDGSTDGTERIAAEYADRGVQTVALRQNQGKTAAQNAAARLATGQVLVFSDANSMYAPNAVQELVRPFADPRVGCVCGELRYTSSAQNPAGKGEGLYWRYERFLKRRESLLGSALGANGSIYAVRRPLFTELDVDIISDFIMPIRIRRAGYRVVYHPAAVAVEGAGNSFQDEFRRRARIISRSAYGLWTERGVLNPFRHGLFAVQMLSHKVLRWLVPVHLLVLLATSAALAGLPWYRAALLAQVIFYLLAGLGHALQRGVGRLPPLYIPAYFCAINLGALVGLWGFIRGRRYRVWQPVARC